MKNNKRCSVMILGALAIFLVNSYNVHASELNVYKCVQPNGRVVFKDSVCDSKKLLEIPKININQSADTDVKFFQNINKQL